MIPRFISSLAFFALSLADETVSLITESSEPGLSALRLTGTHVGPTTNIVFLTNDNNTFFLSDADSSIYDLSTSGQMLNMTAYKGENGGNVLLNQGVAGIPVKEQNGYLTVDGDETFYGLDFGNSMWMLLPVDVTGSSPLKIKVSPA